MKGTIAIHSTTSTIAQFLSSLNIPHKFPHKVERISESGREVKEIAGSAKR
jgi:hypothetical protein